MATAWEAKNAGGNPATDGIFFYSFGKYAEQCEGIKEQVSNFDKSKDTAAPGRER